ncbi:hypothetical protein [Nocardia sp. NPDC127526]|uniref:hypothetical protein n=1 Tax=Nocardia sp. NPDC127526 TaxID=3345393 RepID=UPI003643DC00
MKVFTINVSGRERHDGEKPYTYVLHGDSMIDAKRSAWLFHIWDDISERGTVAADATVPTFSAEYNDIWRNPDHADVVVIDCPQFPCAEGLPFDCKSPIHAGEKPFKGMRKCRCPWHWNAVSGVDLKHIDNALLIELGYTLPDTAPEENTW